MYIPHIYKNENIDEIEDFIQQNSFAILVSQANAAPLASHIPLELEKNETGEDKLVGHLAKANPQWKSFEANNKVLAIFHGPHSYVSSSWYKEEEVPTWNYIAVHIYGTIRIQEKEQLFTSLNRLVDKYEKDSEDPVKIENLSKSTMRQIKGVVGFEIAIEDIQAAYKLSQGRKEDHPRIIEELSKRENPGSREIAEEMKNRTKD